MTTGPSNKSASFTSGHRRLVYNGIACRGQWLRAEGAALGCLRYSITLAEGGSRAAWAGMRPLTGPVPSATSTHMRYIFLAIANSMAGPCTHRHHSQSFCAMDGSSPGLSPFLHPSRLSRMAYGDPSTLRHVFLPFTQYYAFLFFSILSKFFLFPSRPRSIQYPTFPCPAED